MTAFDYRSFLSKLSTEPGVYRMLDSEGKVLYVGKAANLKKRVSSYFTQKKQAAKTESLVSQIEGIEVSITRSETEALLLESNLIKSLRPKYNILMRDDKSYPYIYIDRSHAFPRVSLMRSKRKPKQGDFFGPFPSVLAARETLTLIQKIFKIRNCSDSFFAARSRPCLQYQIKRCTAPCTAYISQEDYRQSLQNALLFLQGKSQHILQSLSLDMEKAVERLEFEQAAAIRDQIKSLRLVQEQQAMVQQKGEADAIAIEVKPGFACLQYVQIRGGELLSSQAFYPSVPSLLSDSLSLDALREQVFTVFLQYHYLDQPDRIPDEILLPFALEDKTALEAVLASQRAKRTRILSQPRGVKARWLDFAVNNLQRTLAEYQASANTNQERYQELQSFLSLAKPIQRMECFDISHTQGQDTVASCVVFDANGPCTAAYRRYMITGITPGDDYAAMRQALLRRYRKRAEGAVLPDVLIIDGGKGQVAVAQEVLQQLIAEGQPALAEIKLLGIAKGPGRKAGWEQLVLSDENRVTSLPEDSKALHLLQYIRDEAHRFAITLHRRKREKKGLSSGLDSIAGIGAKRRQALLRRFGGMRELARASKEEIAKTEGISEQLAASIYAHFH